MGNGRAVLAASLLAAFMFLMSLIVGPSPVNTNSLSNKSFSNESAMLALGAARWMPPSSLKLSGGLGADASMRPARVGVVESSNPTGGDLLRR